MPVVKKYQLYLNSEFADFKKGTDYVGYTLKNPIIKSKEANYFTARVLQSAIPYSFKQFPGATIAGAYVHNAVTYPFVLTISSGNYSIVELLAEFQQQLEAVSHPHTWTFTFTYDPISSFATFAFASNQTFSFSFTYESNFWKACGFLPSSTLAFDNSTTLTSVRHVNVHPINAIQIRSDTLFQIVGNSESLVEANDYSDILVQFFVYGSPNTWILSETGESNPEVRLKNNLIDFVRVYLSSNISYKLDLNGLDWSFALEITEWMPEKTEEKMNSDQNESAMKALASIRENLIQELQSNRANLLAGLPQEQD